MHFVCNGNACCIAVSVSYSNACYCRDNYSCRSEPLQILGKEQTKMKIVVVRSPKMLRGILRMVFGIKKQENTV